MKTLLFLRGNEVTTFQLGDFFSSAPQAKINLIKRMDNYRRDETQAFAVGSEVKELLLILPKKYTVKQNF